MVTILEDLARNSPSAIAKIQAIKTLRLLEAERKEAEEAEERASAFDPLYAVPRRGPNGHEIARLVPEDVDSRHQPISPAAAGLHFVCNWVSCPKPDTLQTGSKSPLEPECELRVLGHALRRLL
jgi:hypothetical protein